MIKKKADSEQLAFVNEILRSDKLFALSQHFFHHYINTLFPRVTL